MKRNKNGFTLVELLAVIVVLAVIMIIAVPAVLSSMENARKNTFVIEARKVLEAGMSQRTSDELTGDPNKTAHDISGSSSKCYYLTEIGIETGGKYHGTVLYDVTSDGAVWKIRLSDGNYQTDGFITMAELTEDGKVVTYTTTASDNSCS